MNKRKLDALNIKNKSHLCKHLGTNIKELENICNSIESYYVKRVIIRKGKERPIAEPVGRLREILDKLQRLLQRISLPPYIHGGRKGHSTLTNAKPHLNQPLVLSNDLKDFFPNISPKRVYDLFYKRLGCSPEIAWYMARLTTLDGSVPQGSPTSTILSSIIFENAAKRINSLAVICNLKYSQYVDDINVSGPTYIKRLDKTIEKIVTQERLTINKAKKKIQYSTKEQTVTGIRVNKQIDVPSKNIKEVGNIISVIREKKTQGTKISEKEISSVKGKIYYIRKLNKGAGLYLLRKLNKILN